MEEIKKAEALSPEIEERISQYETLQSELTRKRMDLMNARFPGRPGIPEASAVDREFQSCPIVWLKHECR